MKRNVFLISAIAVLAAIIMASCASMTVVGIDESSVQGPRQVRQYGAISPNDITVFAYYKDGSTKRAAVSANNISFDSSRPGTQTVVVMISGFRASFQTEVMPLTGIRVVSQNVAWRQGARVRVPRTGGGLGGIQAAPGNDRNNWPGLEIEAEWQGMASVKLSDRDISDDCVFSEFNTGTVGRYEVTVTWRDVQTTFPVNVVALQSIRIDRPPNKTTYVQGERFNDAGLRVIGTWPGLPDSEVSTRSVSGFDTNKVGKQTLTVSIEGKTATFEVEVTERPPEAPPPAPEPVHPIVGSWEWGAYEVAGVEYWYVYNFNADGTWELIHNEAVMASGTYTISGNSITSTVDQEGGTGGTSTFSISGDELTLIADGTTNVLYRPGTRPAAAPVHPIVGRWSHERGIAGDGMTGLIHFYTFNADGTCIRESPGLGWPSTNTWVTSRGTYTVSGNTVTWTIDGTVMRGGTFSISGNQLTIDWNTGADAYVMTRNEK